MREALVVIDMQRDFIDGVLGTREASAIVPSVVKIVEQFRGDIFFTMDCHNEHYLKSQEGQLLPVPHCMVETPGWQLNSEIQAVLNNRHATGVYKSTFGSVELMNQLQQAQIEAVTFVGVCTDICVLTNALLAKTYFPEVPITVIASACAASTPQKQQSALAVLQSCQIIVKE